MCTAPADHRKTAQGQVLLLLLPLPPLSSLMCQADSETGFGHRFEFDHGGRQTLGRNGSEGRKEGRRRQMSFSAVAVTSATHNTSPRHNNNNNRSVDRPSLPPPKQKSRSEISFWLPFALLISSVSATTTAARARAAGRAGGLTGPLPLIPATTNNCVCHSACSVLLSDHDTNGEWGSQLAASEAVKPRAQN